MASNVWSIFQGQTGAVRTGVLSDASGNVDLSQFTSVTVIASQTETSTPVISAAAVIDPDQVTNKGKLSFTFNAADAGVAVNARGYLLSFKCMAGAVPYYFPLNHRNVRTYGRLVVQKPLA